MGVRFFYIYKTLAHPGNNGYIMPFTQKERLMHVAVAKRELGTRIPWICDSMTNDLKHALGDAPNSEFLIDPNGVIVRASRWSRPTELRETLADLFGKVDRPTLARDVRTNRLRPPRTARTGVVPRMELSFSTVPIKVRPVIDESAAAQSSEPFFVKLRAEVESSFFHDGDGKLYLGFFLDPIHKVHWNNRAGPIHFEIEDTHGIQIAPLTHRGPDVREDADADPREFLVDVCDFFADESSVNTTFNLTVHYFACDDAETFCAPVTQRYRVKLERDRDGGSRRNGRRFGRR